MKPFMYPCFRNTLCCLLLVAGALVSVAAPTKIRVGYSYWLPNVPMDVAEAHGWFKEENLEVSFTRTETSQAVIAGLKNGELDLATDMIGSWIECANQGADIFILGEVNWSHGGDKILVRDGADIATMQPKRLGVYMNNLAVSQFLNAYLSSRGLVGADYTLVEVADGPKMQEMFGEGKLRAVVTCEPDAGDMVEKHAGKVVATTADYPGVMPEGFAARGAFVREIPKESLEAFFRVWFRSVAYVADPANAAEVAKIASESTLGGTDTYTVETLTEELAQVPLHTPKQAIVTNTKGGNLQTYFNRCLGFLIKAGRLNPAFKPKEAIYTEPLLQAAAAADGRK